MRRKISIASGMIFLSFLLGGTEKIQASPNINSGFLHLWLNQHALGTIPNMNAAFFKFFNQENNPVGTVISIGDSTVFDPNKVVELAPDQAAFASVSSIFFITEHCEKQDVREVLDFDSPQCQVPEDADPDTTLMTIQSLPAKCMGPKLDACRLFDGDLSLGFATSMPKARQILENDIDTEFVLDGETLNPIENTKPVKFAVSDHPDSQPNPLFNCDQTLHYFPIDFYFINGIRIPSPEGKCMVKGIATPVTPLEPGSHQLEINSNFFGDLQTFPISIFQNAP